MTLSVFPIGPLNGPQPIRAQTWPVTKKINFSTLVNWSTNGARYAVPLFPNNPLWEFEFNNEVIFNDRVNKPLNKNPYYPQGQAAFVFTDLQLLEAFFYNVKGAGVEFVYQPEDSVVTAQLLAVPDINNNVEIIHTIGGYPNFPITNATTFTNVTESVQELNGASPVIKLNGTPIGGWVLQPANSVAGYEGLVINFTSPPGAGNLTADFTYYYRCVFSDDILELDEFMFNLYSFKTIKIQQVRVTS